MNRITRCLLLLALFFPMTRCYGQTPLVRSRGSSGGSPASMRYVTPWSGPFRWLIHPSVQKDLELNDQQAGEVAQLQTEIRQRTQELYRQLNEWPREERPEKLRELYAELAEEVENRIGKILLPEQRNRLQQVELQMRLRSYYRLGQQLASEDLAEALGLTRRQRERMRERGEELRTENQARLRAFQKRLQDEAEKELLKILTPGQQKKLEQLQGDPFEWSPYSAAPSKPAGQGS